MTGQRERLPMRDGLRIETREDGPSRLIGYAAVFYDGRPETQYQLWDDVVERIAPGAFARALREGQDVRALYNHDASEVLGRTPETLILAEDERGLRYEVVLPPTQLARDLVALVQRGDVTGSSFSFTVRGYRTTEEDGITVRTLTDLDLFDVGPVTFPAYEGTEVAARAAVADLHAANLARRQRRIAAAAARARADAAPRS